MLKKKGSSAFYCLRMIETMTHLALELKRLETTHQARLRHSFVGLFNSVPRWQVSEDSKRAGENCLLGTGVCSQACLPELDPCNLVVEGENGLLEIVL